MRQLASLCFNVPGASIYGEISKGSVKKWVECIQLHSQSVNKKQKRIRAIDLGSGSGQTLCHFASFFAPQTIQLTGIEICPQRVDICNQIKKEIQPANVTEFDVIQQDVMLLKRLPNGCTHCISFDKTFTVPLMSHIAQLQTKCKTLEFVITCHKSYLLDSPHWALLQVIRSRQHGSHCMVSFYVFQRRQSKK